jgi:hypothetical protein
MIPVSLFGIDAEKCERFFTELPSILPNAGVNDRLYESRLYKIEGDLCLDHLHIIDQWMEVPPAIWPEDVAQEILVAIDVVKYPNVALVEGLLELDGVDIHRIASWLHFTTNVYPLYNEATCIGLQSLGLNCPYDPNDIASYGVYVAMIEGIKEYAPAGALPEYSLPRQRLLELGLAAWSQG